MENNDHWRLRLKTIAKRKGITNEDIAAHLDVTPGQVSHWFTGRRRIWLHEYIALCRFVLEEPGEILSGKPPPTVVIAGIEERLDRLDQILAQHPEANPAHKKLMKKLRKVKLKPRKKSRKLVLARKSS